MKKSLLTLIPLFLLFIGCSSNKEISKAAVKPHAPLYELLGVDSSYTSKWTDVTGTEHGVELTKDVIKVSRVLSPSSGEPGDTLRSEYNPFEEKLTRNYTVPGWSRKQDVTYTKGVTPDFIYNNAVGVESDHISRMIRQWPDSLANPNPILTKISNQYKFDE